MRIPAIAAGAAALLVSLAATPAAAEKLAITQYGRVTATLPWAVAMKKGFFREEGLNIDEIVTSGGGGTSVRNLLAVDLGFAEVAMSAALAAIRSGIDLKIVSTTSNHLGELVFASLANSPIRTVQDLAGKKVGFTNPRSTTEMVLRVALERAGMLGNVELIATGGTGPALTALANGAIVAGPVNDPAITLQADKYHVLFGTADVMPHVTWAVGVATTEFTQKQPDKLRALLRVHARAVDYIYANPAEATAIYAQVWEVDRAQADRLLPKYFTTLKGHWWRGEFDKEGLDAISKGLIAVGEIDKPVDWKGIIDQSFLPQEMRRQM